MTDMWVSVAVLVAVVLLCEATRWVSARVLPRTCWIYALETVSTFQLCCCSHELKLFGEMGRPTLPVSLTLTYAMAAIHLTTFRGASCNPNGVLEGVCRGNRSITRGGVLVLCQFAAALAAQFVAMMVWSAGMSDLHLRHQRFGYRCFDPLGGTVMEAAGVELACTFAVHAAVMHMHKLHNTLRVHAIAALITVLVYAGGSISGAVFNPVLAFSIQFPCSGHTLLEYCLIFWLSPAVGMVSCILLFEKIIPFLSGKNTNRMDVPTAQAKKMQ